ARKRKRLLLRSLRLRAAREPAEVFGDCVLVALRDLRRRLRAHGRVLALVVARRELELELIGEVHEPLELLLEHVRIAADVEAGTQRLAELADRLELFLVDAALIAQSRAERKQIARRVAELIPRLLHVLGVLPDPAIARIPDAAAPRVVPTARAAGA